MQGRIFSVEEFSTYDGPGIRMTFFLKGCPLRCSWCHNPEGQQFSTEWVRGQNGCLQCGACVRAAADPNRLDENSAAACPRRLVRLCGKDLTPEELCAQVRKNAAILNASGGGVTFSGGEPTAQMPFLLACLAGLHGVTHRAVQTAGYVDGTQFSALFDVCDFFLYDLKLMDGALHRRFCGVDNAPILENYRCLAASDVPFITRVPLIPTVTDTRENLTAIARFAAQNGVQTVELLPYNRMAGGKYAGLLRRYAPDFDETVPVRPGDECIEIFSACGLRATVL